MSWEELSIVLVIELVDCFYKLCIIFLRCWVNRYFKVVLYKYIFIKSIRWL